MSLMTHILLVRHGQTDWNVSRRVMGKLDIPLNEVGRTQAKAAQDILSGLSVDRILHSPYLRTRQTAEVIGKAHAHLPLEPHAALCEVDYGLWEGKAFEDLSAEEAFQLYFSEPHRCQIPGGECMADVQMRMVGLINELREACHGQTVVLVSHSDIIKVALVHYLSLPLSAIHRLSIENGSLSVLALSANSERVVTINRTHGLPSALIK